MAFDEGLAARVRDALAGRRGLVEKRMVGGLAFLLDGNMACGVRGDRLLVRLAPEDVPAALAEPGTSPFEMGGRVGRGWVLVGPGSIAGEAELRRWVGRGLAHAATLPAR
jgi:TfoX N-terminal domain